MTCFWNFLCKVSSWTLPLWRRANARNVSFQTLYGGQFMISIQLIMLNYRRSTIVPLETYPFIHLNFTTLWFPLCYLCKAIFNICCQKVKRCTSKVWDCLQCECTDDSFNYIIVCWKFQPVFVETTACWNVIDSRCRWYVYLAGLLMITSSFSLFF